VFFSHETVRNRIPSYFIFHGMAPNGIPNVFCSAEFLPIPRNNFLLGKFLTYTITSTLSVFVIDVLFWYYCTLSHFYSFLFCLLAVCAISFSLYPRLSVGRGKYIYLEEEQGAKTRERWPD
jgi:hypothetical protein